jgi:hypothetical protein
MTRVKLGAFVLGGLAIAALLAFVVSPNASSKPDGLNKVAMDRGFADQQKDHALDDGPTAGYAVKGVHDDRLSTGLAGLLGVGVTFGLGVGLFVVVRRAGRKDDTTTAPAPG